MRPLSNYLGNFKYLKDIFKSSRDLLPVCVLWFASFSGSSDSKGVVQLSPERIHSRAESYKTGCPI